MIVGWDNGAEDAEVALIALHGYGQRVVPPHVQGAARLDLVEGSPYLDWLAMTDLERVAYMLGVRLVCPTPEHGRNWSRDDDAPLIDLVAAERLAGRSVVLAGFSDGGTRAVAVMHALYCAGRPLLAGMVCHTGQWPRRIKTDVWPAALPKLWIVSVHPRRERHPGEIVRDTIEMSEHDALSGAAETRLVVQRDGPHPTGLHGVRSYHWWSPRTSEMVCSWALAAHRLRGA